MISTKIVVRNLWTEKETAHLGTPPELKAAILDTYPWADRPGADLALVLARIANAQNYNVFIDDPVLKAYVMRKTRR